MTILFSSKPQYSSDNTEPAWQVNISDDHIWHPKWRGRSTKKRTNERSLFYSLSFLHFTLLHFNTVILFIILILPSLPPPRLYHVARDFSENVDVDTVPCTRWDEKSQTKRKEAALFAVSGRIELKYAIQMFLNFARKIEWTRLPSSKKRERRGFCFIYNLKWMHFLSWFETINRVLARDLLELFKNRLVHYILFSQLRVLNGKTHPFFSSSSLLRWKWSLYFTSQFHVQRLVNFFLLLFFVMAFN